MRTWVVSVLDQGPSPHSEEGPSPEAGGRVPELFHQPAQLESGQFVLLRDPQVGDGRLGVIFGHHADEAALADAECGQERRCKQPLVNWAAS